MLGIDAADGLAETTPNQLEPDVAHAHERADAARQQHLNAARPPEPHGTRRERLCELRGRRDDREHAGATYRREPRIVRHGQPRRTAEALEVNGCRKADARAGHQEAELHRVAVRSRARGARHFTGARHAARVVRDGHLDCDLLHPAEQCASESTRSGSRDRTTWSIFTWTRSLSRLGVIRAASEDFLGHCAGRIPRARAHRIRLPLDAKSRPSTPINGRSAKVAAWHRQGQGRHGRPP